MASRAWETAAANCSAPGATLNGAPYATRTLANGFGTQNRSHECSRHADFASA
jgi:hypothetical protein